MRSITPSTPFVQSTNNTIVTNSSHNSTLPHTILPLNDNTDDTLSNTTAPTTTTTFTKFFLSMSKRKLTIMIILSLLLPLLGVYCMSVFHPWIDWVGGALLSFRSEDDAASSTSAAAVHVATGDGASFNGTALVKDDHVLLNHSATSFVKEERNNGQFSSCPSFVEHHGTSSEVTPRQVDGMEDYGIVANDDKDGVGDDGVPHEEEEEGSTSNNEAHTSSSNDNDDDDVICINCHALFRIHVDVSYLSSTAAIESSLAMNTTQEKKNWFITLRDVTYDNDELMYVYQMDRPLDLHCGSSATASAVHRSNDDVCDHSSSSKGGGCSVDTNHNSHVYLQKCQSTAIIEVPYTSFSSSSRYNHSSNYHEVTNERIILVSLLREWSRSSSSQSSEVIIMAKKRRIVDQWMINIVVPNEDGGGRRGVVHSSSIHSAKLRDMVKYDNSIVSKELSKESKAFTGESSSSSSSSSSSTMNEVIIACLVGVLCGLAILAIAFKFVLPQDDDDEEEEEEELMTTPGILALQHAIRGSNSFERSDDGEAESPHQQQQQQQSPQYESNQDRSPSEEQLEAWSAIEQSTPTNLSPLFDDEAETNERASNHHDEADGTEIDDTIQEQAEGFEEVDESRHDDDEESEVEGSIQDQSEEDTHALDEDEAATEMIGEDEETPPTSNKTNKRSTAPRRNSLENIIQEQNESTAISSPLFYSLKYQSNETAPLPHSNTSSVYDQVEHVDGADSNPTTSVEPAIMLLSNRAETNQPTIDYRSEWNEFGAFVHDREVLNADDNKAAATCAGTEEETVNEAKDDPALSGVSKRLFATSKQTTDEVEKASSIHEEVDEVATASSIHEECKEVDESMFLPNVNVQADASPSNFREQRNIPAEATTSPPKLHRATMESNEMTKPTASSDVLAESINSPNTDVQAEAKAVKSPLAEPLSNSQQSINLQSDSPAEMAIAANASATSNKSPPVSSPSNKAYPTLKCVNTPPTAPMSSSKGDNSSGSCASAASFTKSFVEKSAATFDPNDASSTSKGNLGNTSSITAAQQLPASPSPESHHALSYVNQSLSLSSSPSVTSPPRKSNSPSVTSDPRFSPGGWNNSDIGSNDEVRQRKRRSLPFVSREDTSRAGKENASSNSRTPLSAKASKYSPSSTVAATVAEFAVPRTKNGLAWRAERPVPVPSGGAGQNKRLGGSPAHFEPRGASTKGDKSNDEAIDFMNGADLSSQNDDSEPNGSSRSGKRSSSSRGSKKNTSRKRKTKVEKKLLATIKTSDKHKPPSGLSSLSQRLNEEMWEHSHSQSSSANKIYDV